VLLVRVVERPREPRPGFTGLPRWSTAGELTIDWVANAELESIDPRVVRRRSDGLIRLTFTSHLRVVVSGLDTTSREITNVAFHPRGEVEEFGVEDPRITALDGRFYFTYVAVSRHGPATALASTLDFRTFERHGIIFCPENKDVVLVPERIGGSYAAFHRPVCGGPFSRPAMWAARSPDLIHWGGHMPLILPSHDWQSGRVGAGPPPIRISEGWLAIYHGNRLPSRPGEVGAYSAGAMLLDADDPRRILKRTTEPFMRPEADFETTGFVPNVVFPTGLIQTGEKLSVYYGAADTVCAVAEFELKELLETMTPG
ncbi:MAG TPA: glycoside hydrolase family 130 protein, partial [Gemmataceae bacterium]